MEHIFEAYTRDINGKTYYFVKKFSTFPEYVDSHILLDSMGMHTDFFTACRIAQINDEAIIHKLMAELNIIPDVVRVISMRSVKAVTYSLIKNTHQAISKLGFSSN
ncbi:MAG: hypothetical protein ABI372_04975 [Ginsengibacter sp.]